MLLWHFNIDYVKMTVWHSSFQLSFTKSQINMVLETTKHVTNQWIWGRSATTKAQKSINLQAANRWIWGKSADHRWGYTQKVCMSQIDGYEAGVLPQRHRNQWTCQLKIDGYEAGVHTTQCHKSMDMRHEYHHTCSEIHDYVCFKSMDMTLECWSHARLYSIHSNQTCDAARGIVGNPQTQSI